MSEYPDITFHKRERGYITDAEPGEYLPLQKQKGYGDVAWAAWGCPRCGEVLLISRNNHRVDVYGRVTPALRCITDGCKWIGKVFLDNWVPEAKGNA